ncbi:hypothetical protein F5051DRAFT_338405, partial [Lentinula edodes]
IPTSMPMIVFWTVDFVETLPAEINVMWKKRMTGASALFLVNRYSFLLSLVLQMVGSLPGNGSDRKCQRIYITYGVSSSISLAITNILFSLRVYAVYNQRRIIFGISLLYIIPRLGLDILLTVFPSSASTSGSQFQDFAMCVQTVAPFLALAFDTFTFVLTVRKTIHHAIRMYRLKESSITQVIILDGKYLILKSNSLRLLDLLFHSLTCGYSSNYPTASILTSAQCKSFRLPNLLISRLMLNLRTYSASENSITTTQGGARTQQSSLNFATNRMLGNIGAPLDGESFGEGDEQEEEAEFRAVGENHEEFEQGQG